MKKHESTIEQHVKCHVGMAIDQKCNYESLEQTRDSYAQNVYDSCVEDGYTASEAANAADWFMELFREMTGV